jgi:hypothetical protein
LKLVVVIVVASMAVENVAVTVVPTATPVAPLAGDVDVTVGVGATAPVENDQLYAVWSANPSAALIAVVRFMVYVVLEASEALGVNVEVFVVELYESEPATLPLGPARNAFAAISVDVSIALLHVNVTAEVTATLVAPLAGVVEVTSGPLLSTYVVTVADVVLLPALSVTTTWKS